MVRKGANLNAADNLGKTALQYAIQFGNLLIRNCRKTHDQKRNGIELVGEWSPVSQRNFLITNLC